MHPIEAQDSIHSLTTLRRVLEVLDFPEGGGSIDHVYVSRRDELRTVDRLVELLKKDRAEQIKDLTWEDVESEYNEDAEGCTAEMAPNPEEYVREYYPEKYDEWLNLHREEWGLGPNYEEERLAALQRFNKDGSQRTYDDWLNEDGSRRR